MIIVAGATGNVGREVVGHLAGAGHEVTALVREPGRATFPASVRTAAGDLNEPSSLTAALDGARAAFLLSGYRDMPGLLDEVRRAGAERVVLLSGGAAVSTDLGNPIARYMIDSERVVMESGLAWTTLRPSAFMSNTLQWAEQLRAGDVVRAPFADIPIATVDPYDIAAVAATALTGEGHDGLVYKPTGPASMTPAERVAVLGDVLGRSLRFEGQSEAEARAEMSGTMPDVYIDAFFGFVDDGTYADDGTVRATVREVTGRDPRTFRQWALAHADAFR